jgi:hypothetical protein
MKEKPELITVTIHATKDQMREWRKVAEHMRPDLKQMSDEEVVRVVQGLPPRPEPYIC